MRMQNKVVFSLLCIVLLATSIAFAQEKDIEGSKDHPLISRFAGSIINHYDVKQFDEYILPLGKLDEEEKLTKSQRLAGKITRIQYKAPGDRSTLEMYRNYELALKKAGFEILFTGTLRELGERWTHQLYGDINRLRGNARLHIRSYEDFRYLSAKLSRLGEGDVYVTLCISLGLRWPTIQLDVIEVKPMEIGLVTAGTMLDDITRTGRVAIYGIYFDTDKADVKPESEPTLAEIAKLLQQNHEIELYVVGHTDNVGGLDYNMDLSKRRADAVVKELVSKYDVDINRLKAHGVGSLAPVSSNETEEGRAKNRRVELVEQ